MRPLVLDGSMVLRFFLPDERADDAEQLIRQIESGRQAYVPSLWWSEIVNGLLMAERRKRTTRAEVASAVAALADLSVITDDEPLAHSVKDALALAREHKLTVYDAIYLELAVRRGCSLATADGELAKAAKATGVPLIGPEAR